MKFSEWLFITEGMDYYQNPEVKKELDLTGRVSIRTLMKLGLGEGESAQISRELNKKYGDDVKHGRFLNQLDQARINSETDEYYYHITPKYNLKNIMKNGLLPDRKSTFSNYTNNSKGKIFLCEKNGIEYWKERVENHIFHNTGNNSGVAVIKIKKTSVPKIMPDITGTSDSRSPAYYTTIPIPPSEIAVA